jgi:hypothetical protein
LGIKSSGKVLLVPQFENDYYSMLPWTTQPLKMVGLQKSQTYLMATPPPVFV